MSNQTMTKFYSNQTLLVKQSQYKDYLKSQSWKRVKVHHYKKEKNKHCFICGSTTNPHLHHLVYKDKFGLSFVGRENSSILRTLCRQCHKLYHQHIGIPTGSMRFYYRIQNLLSFGVDKPTAFRVATNRRLYKKTLRQAKRKLKAKGNLDGA